MVISHREFKETKKMLFRYKGYSWVGRETFRIDCLTGKNSGAPSPVSYFSGHERTQYLINASFLPFFALLSIPPSFN